MNKLRIRKIRHEKKLIGQKLRYYVVFGILVCCLVVVFNLHSYDSLENNIINNVVKKHEMVYIFHDYEGNEYIMNDKTHGSADFWNYLFDDKVPDLVKCDNTDSSLNKIGNKNNMNYTISFYDIQGYTNNHGTTTINMDKNDTVKDNQISITNIMEDLGITSETDEGGDNNYLIIDLTGNKSDINLNHNENSYTVIEGSDGSSLIIKKDKIKDSTSDDNLLPAKAFSFTIDGRVIPILLPWDELHFGNSESKNFNSNIVSNHSDSSNSNTSNTKKSGITIIDDYADCMTPRGYKIVHGDNVLAYKQLDGTPDMCNIERRYCWDGKLSGTFTQQGCYINKNYSYEMWGEAEVPVKDDSFRGGTRQNPDGTVTVKNEEIIGGFVFDKPNKTSTEYSYNDSYREETPGVEQTTRPHRGCTTPWGEKVQHGEVILAFKHANGFSDAPCEMQFRLCTMGELMGTYTEPSCQTRDTSFIDWINGSPTRKTYSEEKLELVRKQIEAEELYYENARKQYDRSTNSDTLDKILWILDQD